MKAGIIIFPGTNRERDIAQALFLVSGRKPKFIWHQDDVLPDLDLVIIPGGFSYGDYLRCGAIAARSPIMARIKRFADEGGYILGVCNGFQILTEAKLLPGALIQNITLRFISSYVFLKVEESGTPFTKHWRKGAVFRAVVAHGDGNYVADEADLDNLEGEGRVIFRYASAKGEIDSNDPTLNPNGSARSIAGILSSNRRICGLMPHAENLVSSLYGGEDGKPLFTSILEAVAG